MEDLQSLLEKINREGIEKAEAEANKILADARAEATRIVTAAQAEATQAREAAAKDAADASARAAETIRQAARDTVLSVEAGVTALLEKILRREVDAALAKPDLLAELAERAIAELAGPGEISVAPALANALAARLAARTEFTVTTDETRETGFSVKTDGGRVEHSFRGKTVSDELARRLRPDLAALLK